MEGRGKEEGQCPRHHTLGGHAWAASMPIPCQAWALPALGTASFPGLCASDCTLWTSSSLTVSLSARRRGFAIKAWLQPPLTGGAQAWAGGGRSPYPRRCLLRSQPRARSRAPVTVSTATNQGSGCQKGSVWVTSRGVITAGT